MKFNELFDKVLKEDNLAGGAGGAFTTNAGTIDAGSTGGQFGGPTGGGGNVDSYAPGDARIPHVLGQKKKRKKGKKGKKRRNLNKEENNVTPVARRSFPENIWLSGITEQAYYDMTTPLMCSFVIKNDQFKKLTKLFLEKDDIKFESESKDGVEVLMFTGLPKKISSITEKIRKFYGENTLDSGDNIVILISEPTDE